MNSADRKHRKDFSKFAIALAHPGIELLNLFWHEANRDFFDSKMVVPYILLSEPTHTHAIGQYHPRTSIGANAEIRIRPSILTGKHRCTKYGDKFKKGRMLFASDILLHEMIHQWQHEIVQNTEKSQSGHGPLFRDKCNEIGNRLGLQSVRSAKARGSDADYPSCSHWPHNVRSVKYYCGAVVNDLDLTPVGALCRVAMQYGMIEDRENREALCNAALVYYKSRKKNQTPVNSPS